MYLFYLDESGNRDPSVQGRRADGSTFDKDHIYVLVALSLHEWKWHKFERNVNEVKLELLADVRQATGRQLELADAEVHSSVIRRAKERNKHPLFRFLSPPQLLKLTECMYRQLDEHYMHLFAVVVDKRKIADYMDQAKLHRKAYELLLERIQNFLQEFHAKHLGLIVADDMSIQMNRSLAMKHSFFQRTGTTAGLRMRNIVETPFFVRSELSNGVQLADLCAYNVYRTFRYESPDYPYFARILPRIYHSQRTSDTKLDGLKVFPDDSELVELGDTIGRKIGRHRTAKPRDRP